MKILFIGDIYGRPGRETVAKLLPEVRKEFAPDLIIANPENMSHGNGFSVKNIEEMRAVGVDFFTSGNHVWENKEGAAKLADPEFPVLRPANYPEDVVGDGYRIVEAGGKRVLVISLLGRVFMRWAVDCPLRTCDRILKECEAEHLDAIFVDIHAEATSEKSALAYYLDGRVSAVVGTHTHVQTNDARVLENGTAFITDVGMTGPRDSVIGVKKEIIVHQFLSQIPVKHDPETTGKMEFSAVLVEIDPETKKALNVTSIHKLIDA